MSYPDTMRSARSCSMTCTCKKCCRKWDVDGTMDLGSWEPDDEDDAVCECGSVDVEFGW